MKTPHFKHERTMVMIKPDGIQRSLIGEIIGRFEQIGLKLVAIKMFVPSSEFVRKHYLLDPEWPMKVGTKSIKAYADKGEKHPVSADPIKVSDYVLDKLTHYLSSGPVVAMVWQGSHAAEIVRKLTGGTEPRSSDVGTIRGDFMLDSYAMGDTDNRAVRNLLHASGSEEEAQIEIDHWFHKDEIIDYRHIQESILYDVNLDGRSE